MLGLLISLFHTIIFPNALSESDDSKLYRPVSSSGEEMRPLPQLQLQPCRGRWHREAELVLVTRGRLPWTSSAQGRLTGEFSLFTL